MHTFFKFLTLNIYVINICLIFRCRVTWFFCWDIWYLLNLLFGLTVTEFLYYCIFVLVFSEWENECNVECVFGPLMGVIIIIGGYGVKIWFIFHCFVCFILWWFSMPFCLILVIVFLFMWVWWVFIDSVCFQIWCFDHVLNFSSNFYTFSKSICYLRLWNLLCSLICLTIVSP